METFDLVVVGGGPAGATAAKVASLRGFRVALVAEEPLMGYGLEGAYKSKALYELARDLHAMARRQCQPTAALDVDLSAISDQNNRSADALRRLHRHEFQTLGVTVAAGRGRLVDAHTVVVGDRALRGDRLLIATGTRPRTLPHVRPDGRAVLTSDEIVRLDHLPRSMLVLGAGVIGCEFASIFAALGVEVTLVDTRPRILSHEDQDIGALLTRSFESLRMSIRAGARCESIDAAEDGVRTTLTDGWVVQSEVALLAIGRVPNTGGLGLEAAGVSTDATGYIPVDEYLRTNVPHIYAAGDVGLRDTPLDLALVHVAEAEARCAVAHMLGDALPLELGHVPFIVFTVPMVAGAGDSEDMARRRLGDVRIGKYANVRNHRCHARGSRSGFVKLIVGPEGDDRVLGVRGVGHGVDTVIGEVSLMIRQEVPYQHLLTAMHAHPSLSESLAGAAMIVASQALAYDEDELDPADRDPFVIVP